MLKAYVAVDPPHLGQAIHRVARALAEYTPPDVQIVEDRTQADLVVMHLIGWAHWETLWARLRGDQRYAVVAYCVSTTERSNPDDWWWAWVNADVVWSYYDLSVGEIDFYHAPLGIDPAFVPCGCGKPYLVGTSGYVDGMEAISEWSQVCAARGAFQFHLGPNLGLAANVTYANGLSDADLAKKWGSCSYVSGLRRVEGFELPAYEGLACGARPVMFDRPDARMWLGDHAEYIPEDDHVVESLTQLVARPYRHVTAAEATWARETFDWRKIIGGFWGRVGR